MKNFTFLALLILSISINAQITKISTLETNQEYVKTFLTSDSLKIFDLHNTNNYIPNSTSPQYCVFILKVFTSNMKLLKTDSIQLPVKSIYNDNISIGGFTKNIFDNSGKIVFYISYRMQFTNISGTAFQYNTIYYNEAGKSILILNNIQSAIISGTQKTGFLLNAYYNNWVSQTTGYDTYSLPGKGEIDTIPLITTVYSYDTIRIHKTIYDTLKLSKTVVTYDTTKTTKIIKLIDTTYQHSNTIIQDNNPTTIETQNSDLLLKPFPNPSSSYVNIPYSISSNGQLKAYNAGSVLINTYSVLSSSNSIVIDISKYAIGTYTYKIDNLNTGKFIKN